MPPFLSSTEDREGRLFEESTFILSQSVIYLLDTGDGGVEAD